MTDMNDVIDGAMRERIARRAAEMFAENPDCSRWAHSFDEHVEEDDLLNDDGRPSEALVVFARGRVDEAIGTMSSVFSSGSASAWRAVSGYDDLLEEIASSGEIGIHWAGVQEAAFAHWGGKGELDLIFRAEVKAEDVNWPETILANALDAGADEGFHEAEIRLKPDAHVRILEINSRPSEDIFYDSSYSECTPVELGPVDGLELRAGREGGREDRLVLVDDACLAPAALAFG
jgi:hypothetical protein